MLSTDRGGRVETDGEGPDAAAARFRRRVRALSWSAAAAAVVVVVIVAIALHDHSKSSAPSDAPSTVATNARVLVSFDDRGLHLSPPASNAGIIQFSFADHRTKQTGETLLYYELEPNVGGDLITGVGGSVRVLLCPHTYYLVVRVDGAVAARTAFGVTGKSSYCTKPAG